MLQQFSVSGDRNIQMNFDALFAHNNRFYLGAHSGKEITSFNVAELPCGAQCYDSDSHTLKILTADESGSKLWKTIQFV